MIVSIIGSVIGTVLVMGLGYLARHTLGTKATSLIRFLPRKAKGRWKTTFWKDGTQHYETATVHQFLDNIWGTIYYEERKRRYRFRGTIRDSILVATYEIHRPQPEAPDPLDRGAFTLRLSDTGRAMNGAYAWTDDGTPGPQGGKYEWKIIEF